MPSDTVRTASGRSLDELNMGPLCAGELTAEDFRISGGTLRRQADAAEAAGYWQLAENLRRAAELTAISNQEVFDMYKALRPNRSTYDQLITLADHLENDLDAPLTAAFVREAAEVYQERDILRNMTAPSSPSA
jgi:propanediol dehydratase small subunit